MAEVTFLKVKYVDENGKLTNEKFFEGRMPNIGDAVEYVYVGAEAGGDMLFQLKVRER